MNQQLHTDPPCRSVFRGDAATTTSEKYTHLWIALINQMERSKQILAGAR